MSLICSSCSKVIVQSLNPDHYGRCHECGSGNVSPAEAKKIKESYPLTKARDSVINEVPEKTIPRGTLRRTAGATENLFGPYVTFGFNSIDHRVQRIGGYQSLQDAQTAAHQGRGSLYHHTGVAKVTHPQKIWFYKTGKFISVDSELTLEIITLLGI